MYQHSQRVLLGFNVEMCSLRPISKCPHQPVQHTLYVYPHSQSAKRKPGTAVSSEAPGCHQGHRAATECHIRHAEHAFCVEGMEHRASMGHARDIGPAKSQAGLFWQPQLTPEHIFWPRVNCGLCHMGSSQSSQGHLGL